MLENTHTHTRTLTSPPRICVPFRGMADGRIRMAGGDTIDKMEAERKEENGVREKPDTRI